MHIIDDRQYFRPAPIAIVGIGCRFPGSVTDARSFWSPLRSRRFAIEGLPAPRVDETTSSLLATVGPTIVIDGRKRDTAPI